MVYRIDTRKLDSLEFNMLTGTENAVRMIRNRAKIINLDDEMYSNLLDYLDSNAQEQYHIRWDDNKHLVIYFEHPIDKENAIVFLNQNMP